MILRLKHANFDLFAKKSGGGGLGLRNAICEHAVFANKSHLCWLLFRAAFVEKKKMPERCVVYGCDNTANSKQVYLYIVYRTGMILGK